MRSLTARNDIARTIRHRAPIWDTTAIDNPVHEEARRGCGQSSVACLPHDSSSATSTPQNGGPAGHSSAHSSSSAVDSAAPPAPLRPCPPNTSRYRHRLWNTGPSSAVRRNRAFGRRTDAQRSTPPESRPSQPACAKRALIPQWMRRPYCERCTRSLALYRSFRSRNGSAVGGPFWDLL